VYKNAINEELIYNQRFLHPMLVLFQTRNVFFFRDYVHVKHLIQFIKIIFITLNIKGQSVKFPRKIKNLQKSRMPGSML